MQYVVVVLSSLVFTSECRQAQRSQWMIFGLSLLSGLTEIISVPVKYDNLEAILSMADLLSVIVTIARESIGPLPSCFFFILIS